MYSEVSARKLLHNISKIPISLTGLSKTLGINLLFTDLGKINAYFMTIKSKKIIMVNDNHSKYRQRFSIAHEFGHAVLNHGPIVFFKDSSLERPRWQETQANRFAAELLMPKDLLKRYGYLRPEEISDLCEVSIEAATIRARQLGWLQ
jgi:Zn-dependent peptidase ImmA (M78 family)